MSRLLVKRFSSNVMLNVPKQSLGVASARLISSFGTASTSSHSSSDFQSYRRLAVFAGLVGVGVAINSPEAKCLASSGVWDDVRGDIVKIIEDEDKRRGDGTGIGPTFVRLAWHSSGTYSKYDKTGGSAGATMRFSQESGWGANQGLVFARRLLEPIKHKYPKITYADLWTFAGKVAIEEAGGPVIPWKPGRPDADNGKKTVPDGRLPDAGQGASHIRDVFGRMGFTDQETVALLGAHALGRCHVDNSGFWGPWTRAETTFSNEYFRLLLEEKWTPKKTHEGKAWEGPLQYEDKSGELMMTPADLALVQDPELKKYVIAYAKDEELFKKDFASAFGKLMELGVDFQGESFFDKIKRFLGL